MNLAGAELRQHTLVATVGFHAVGVHPRTGIVAESCPYFVFQFLRSQTAVANRSRLAIRAGQRRWFLVIAVVTNRGVFLTVEGERQFAVLAVQHVAASWALDVCRKPAPVEQ